MEMFVRKVLLLDCSQRMLHTSMSESTGQLVEYLDSALGAIGVPFCIFIFWKKSFC